MHIVIDTDTITDSDRALLTSLLSAPTPLPAEFLAAVRKVGEAATSVVKPPVAKEAGDDPADAVTPAEPELPYDEAPTMADALAAATQAVSAGGSARVKAALASVSSKRVSEMKVEDIPAFLAALSAE